MIRSLILEILERAFSTALPCSAPAPPNQKRSAILVGISLAFLVGCILNSAELRASNMQGMLFNPDGNKP